MADHQRRTEVSWRKQRSKVEQRLRVVLWAQDHGPKAAARESESSRTTVYALLVRYDREGLQGLMSRPRGPPAYPGAGSGGGDRGAEDRPHAPQGGLS
ncbi:MAG: helix-turn-helix domain-containing protein [Armatimonadota bacterium]